MDLPGAGRTCRPWNAAPRCCGICRNTALPP